jgi:hypothetical protein
MSSDAIETADAPLHPIESQAVGHHAHGIPERPSVDARHLVWLGGAALLLLGGAIFGLGAIYWHEVPNKTMPPVTPFPQPRVDADETEELNHILQKQRQEFTGYHWANQQHTLVQIPIERAMKIIAQKGAHGYDPVASIPGALSSAAAGAERLTTPTAMAPGNQPSTPPSAPPNGPSNAPANGAKAEGSP